MMNDFLFSQDFEMFMDEALRIEAIKAVDAIICKSEKAISRHQLHSIPSVIQGAGLSGLKHLVKKQKEKNINNVNKDFWLEIDGLLSDTGGSAISLFRFLKTYLLERGLIENEDHLQDKNDQKQVRKRNKDLVEMVMSRILGIYFEHFNCHYYYKTHGGLR
ncbi:MAG: hypothetical protein ACOZF0_07195 [Thermodesulfobacteriota bacterium]